MDLRGHGLSEDEDDDGESPENHASLRLMGRRLAFRVRGGDGVGSNYTVNTGKLC